MTIARSVALVGRPNVGKSRLFNRLAGKRISIVHDQPGVTRDLVTALVPADKGGYLLMDTGGLGMPASAASAAIAKATEDQVDFAIQAAGVVLFVTDAKEGVTLGDERIVERLRSCRKPTILVVNKVDDTRRESEAEEEFSQLHFGEVVTISAEHGRGMDALESRILQIIGPAPETAAEAKPTEERVTFALIGRPNVGKSSLGNALLNNKRLIVNETPGTTRDAIAIDLDYNAPNGEKWPFTLMDTAGLRHTSQVKTSVEYFSQNRTREAIEGCAVVFLVLDAMEGVTKQDKMLAGDVLRSGAGLVVVVNKWDIARKRFEQKPLEGYANVSEFRDSFVRAIERELFFLPKSPIIFTSALEGFAVTDILKEARTLFLTMRKELATGVLNRVLRAYLEANPPKFVGARRFKCYYAVQVARQPFVIRLYCNHAEKLDEGYARHLAAGVQTAFKLFGCPIRFDLVGKPEREKQGSVRNKPKWEGKFIRGRSIKPGKPGEKGKPERKGSSGRRLPPVAED